MSLEHSPARDNQGARDTAGADPPDDLDYWHSLINEKIAAQYLGLTERALQGMRQRGVGPRFVRISSRCVRYSRLLLKSYTDSQIRTSTADQSQAVD